ARSSSSGCRRTGAPCRAGRSVASAPGSSPSPRPARRRSWSGPGPAIRTAGRCSIPDGRPRPALAGRQPRPAAFFEPIQLHFEAADLLVELGLDGLVVLGSGLAAVLEQALGPGE